MMDDDIRYEQGKSNSSLLISANHKAIYELGKVRVTTQSKMLKNLQKWKLK